MLLDKDKIFSNLHGTGSVDISAALARGDWQGIGKIFEQEPGNIIDEIKNAGLRGRGGGRFSNWLEMVLYAPW